MTSEAKYSKVVGDLRGALARFKPGQKIYDEIVATREEVFAKYRPIFSPEHVPSLTREEFTSFLYFVTGLASIDKASAQRVTWKGCAGALPSSWARTNRYVRGSLKRSVWSAASGRL